MIELLSPGGNFEKIKIALAYGADAVYSGVSHFSLRSRASKDFTYENFGEAVEYTHARGKKIYATINGFPFNSQIELLKKHIVKMAALKPDAFIVSTPGVVALCRELTPEIELHLSTQANVLNYMDAKFYHDMGVERIVAAREVSLSDLITTKKEVPKLELEVFVHGSMCFAYSGRCLISSVQSGRVSNRGSCANDCRFPYTLYAQNEKDGTLFKIEEHDEGTYIMNAKDLNMASSLDQILSSGAIDSLKIEGRTKSVYYIAKTAQVYKMAIQDFQNHKFKAEYYEKELNKLANRGFSDGYLVNRPHEKLDTQTTFKAMIDGDSQVHAMVCEDEKHFLTKWKIIPNKDYELMSPLLLNINIDNDIGTIYEKKGIHYINFKKLTTQKGKELDAVHSGNPYKIRLPGKLPEFSFIISIRD